MKYPPKIAALAIVAVLSVAGLTAVTTAFADSYNRSEWSKPGMGKHHGGKKMCNRHGGKHGMRGPDTLAKKLSVMETEIGIRANQLDDWRDFTDALQATMMPPMMGRMGPGGMGPGGPGPRMMAPDESAEPFSMAERFADNTINRAKSAEDLKAAIAKLRTTLTPEQLDKVKAIEARLRARMAQAHGWHHGPHGKGHHGKGPHGDGPDAGKPAPDDAPAAKPDAPGDDNDDNDDSL
jgi:hypothetical protein